MKSIRIILFLLVSLLLVSVASAQEAERARIYKEFTSGNFKDAYDGYRKLILNKSYADPNIGIDIGYAIDSLQRLSRYEEIDAFLEEIAAERADNWRALAACATQYYSLQHNGYIVSGKFNRGYARGGVAKYVQSKDRDRIRSIQLFLKAIDLAKDPSASGAAEIWFGLAGSLDIPNERWKLAAKSDLQKLPDYEEGYYYGSGDSRGAPVDAEGKPVFYPIPDDFNSARNDGERYRAALAKAASFGLGNRARADYTFAKFLEDQFSVRTMGYQYGYLLGRKADENQTSGTYALHTLSDTETIARLATGIRRLTLPDEFNPIKIYYRLSETSEHSYFQHAMESLGQIYEDRRQYVTAAKIWKSLVDKPNYRSNNYQDRLNAIVGAWGRFENAAPQAAGKPATVEFIFRNGQSVALEAYRIDIDKLIDDAVEYLKSNPWQFNYQTIEINNIGYRLIQEGDTKYIGERVASWQEQLEPRANHFDKRITLKTPLKSGGAYLLKAKMASGNTSQLIVWINDLVILKKSIEKGTAGASLYYIADAETGAPIADAKVKLFGYRQEYSEIRKIVGKPYNLITTERSETSNAQGFVTNEREGNSENFQWLIRAKTANGRSGYLGFSWQHYYSRGQFDNWYNEIKTYVITDRPVYRPGHTVKYKMWIARAAYDAESKSEFAEKLEGLSIFNPQNETVTQRSERTDSWGGLQGEYKLPEDAPLGVYRIGSTRMPYQGGSFRVEEYKKPEFEVSVEAPKDPVQLGDKIEATIQAKYYFGAPVTDATVRFKVTRTEHQANWYPAGIWDWFYGPGYWWFAYDYFWYPGWNYWGCKRPIAWWWPQRHQNPPELVQDQEVKVGPDGTVKVQIDTSIAKELHGDSDHRYEITVEVVDQSRRTITGSGEVLVSRKPFQVYAWVDRGYYRTGDPIRASFNAQTLDRKPVKGKGELKLIRITYNDKREPVEDVVEKWNLDTSEEGTATQQLTSPRAGQYRLSYSLRNAQGKSIEGAYIFTVMGEQADAKNYRFQEIELIPDRREYATGDKLRLLINTKQENSSVLLFLRPVSSAYREPELIRITGKSYVKEINIETKDMPNFFVEAATIHDGKVFTETKEIIVPPAKRTLDVKVLPSSTTFKPGELAKYKVQVTETDGKPYEGSLVMSVYDKSVEYISGGSNVPEIRAHFWKWRRQHYEQHESNDQRVSQQMVAKGEKLMSAIGFFGNTVADEEGDLGSKDRRRDNDPSSRQETAFGGGTAMPASAPMKAGRMNEVGGMQLLDAMEMKKEKSDKSSAEQVPGEELGQAAMVQPTVRKEFADTAFWASELKTDREGVAQVEFKMPENLTTWKARTWAIGAGSKVGEGSAEVVTTKNLLVRLQAPRFFVEKDEVVLSANLHNYLKSEKSVRARLELSGESLEAMSEQESTVTIPANGETRVDWRVKVVREGEAVVRMLALSDEESDAMEMRFPVYVHGMLKTESFSGALRPDEKSSSIAFKVPNERRPEQSRLEVRYSPTLAGAMVDALPYLVSYPYGCTEQTLSRFLPTVITQKILQGLNLDLKSIKEKRANLNAQERGEAGKRAEQWQRYPHNPVFDLDEVASMTRAGLNRLQSMQLSDGGWGWFSGWGENSSPHTTAYVVHGLQIADALKIGVNNDSLSRGVSWLENYQAGEIQKLKNAPTETAPWKNRADALDAFVFMVLADAGKVEDSMLEFLFRDRTQLPVYAKSIYGLALQKIGNKVKLAEIMKNLSQYVVEDNENQTAYLRLGNEGYWWYWYGSEIEAQSYYLKLLAATDPKGKLASRLVKYLLNNRKNSTYWNSTRDTAVAIEALADYLKASGEDQPDMTLEVLLDGKKQKEVKISRENLFSFDNLLVLSGDAITSGQHKLELRRSGKGPVYFNAYLENFTLEDFITKAGLEIKVQRKYYLLTETTETELSRGGRGQAIDEKTLKYVRTPLENLSAVKSGQLVEIELSIESKNDYEYLVFEDMKPAGFEPVEVRSGYNGNDMGAYVEFRDEKVAFFVRALPRGERSVSYRMRAEIPGKFSALPTMGYGMYAPELKANSDEIKLEVGD